MSTKVAINDHLGRHICNANFDPQCDAKCDAATVTFFGVTPCDAAMRNALEGA